jgi:polysaccharide pyruvyl transferase WcaK-like protein
MRHLASRANLPVLFVEFTIILHAATAIAQDDAPAASTNRHLLSAFSWGTGNIGDIAIAPGLLNLLGEVEPELPVVVMTSQTAGSESFTRIAEYLPRYSKHCRAVAYPFAIGSDTNAGAPGSAWRAFHDRWGASTLRAFENGTLSARVAARVADDVLNRLPREVLDELKDKNPEAALALTDAGFVLFTSGTTLNFGRMGQRRFYSFSLKYAMPLLIARVLGIPYGVGGQSFEALDWPSDLVFRPLFKDAQFVYCRDPDSLAYLAQRDLLAPRSGFRPDSTFFFQGFDEPWLEAYLREHALTPKQFITLTIRSARSQPGPLADTISQERQDEHMERIRTFVTEWVERTGVPVVLCPEVRYEIPLMHDNVFLRLAPEVQKKCVWMDQFWTTEQAYSLYRQAEMVVSMEMHSVIMALSLGTPVLMPQFAENGRKVWMLEELGLRDWIFDIDEPADSPRLLETALKIHRHPAQAEARVRRQLPHVRQLGLEMVTEIMLARRK